MNLLKSLSRIRIGKRGQVATAMLFVVVFFFLLVFFILVAPLTARFSTEVTAAGVELLKDTNEVAAQIADENISSTITGITTEAVNSTQTNAVIGLTLAKYGWVLLLAIIAIVMYLRSRILVEHERRGLV